MHLQEAILQAQCRREATIEAVSHAQRAYDVARRQAQRSQSRAVALALWEANGVLERATQACHAAHDEVVRLCRREERQGREAACSAWRATQGVQADLFSA